MKRIVKNSIVAAALAAPLLAIAATPAAGLFNTHHDFASRAGFMATQLDSKGVPSPGINSVGLCSYCHTPHSAFSTSLLWNHKLSAASFSWDDAATSGGTAYPTLTPTYKGPSVKCLSCHDGTIAIGDVALYKETTGGVFNTLKLDDGSIVQIAKNGSLSGNHPIGMPYPLGNAAGTYNNVTTGSSVTVADFVANPVNVNGTKVKLYNDNGSGGITGGAVAGKSGIECSSCHDVHNKESVDDLLLRGKISGSTAAGGYICLQCHTK